MLISHPMDASLRYHGRASAMPPDTRIAVEAITGRLDGFEIVTVGPTDVEVEFPLPPAIAAIFNKHCNARPTGCRDAYIYGLRGPDGCYFYVGSTVKSLTSRLQSHISAARRGQNNNRRLAKKLAELGDAVEIALIETTSETHRFEREYEIIHDYLSSGARLLNSQLAQKIRPGKVYST